MRTFEMRSKLLSSVLKSDLRVRTSIQLVRILQMSQGSQGESFVCAARDHYCDAIRQTRKVLGYQLIQQKKTCLQLFTIHNLRSCFTDTFSWMEIDLVHTVLMVGQSLHYMARLDIPNHHIPISSSRADQETITRPCGTTPVLLHSLHRHPLQYLL